MAVTGDPTQAPIPAETDSPTDAPSRLSEIAEADEPYIEADVLDRWVPQISSKKPDTTLPDGSVWDAASILSDHRTWREQFPRVHLLWSGDYSTFELTDYWVTIVAVPYDTPEGALGWCNDHALPDDDCYAKLISHTHPHEDSTRLR
jgi:serine/threonine-protein kinase